MQSAYSRQTSQLWPQPPRTRNGRSQKLSRVNLTLCFNSRGSLLAFWHHRFHEGRTLNGSCRRKVQPPRRGQCLRASQGGGSTQAVPGHRNLGEIIDSRAGWAVCRFGKVPTVPRVVRVWFTGVCTLSEGVGQISRRQHRTQQLASRFSAATRVLERSRVIAERLVALHGRCNPMPGEP